MLPFIDLDAQRKRIGPKIEAAIARVLEHGQFIMGPEVSALEERLGAFAGAAHVVSCASGTDAMALVLMAKGVKPGDAVLCPSFTFCATAEVIVRVGATPIFVDSERATFNLDTASLVHGIAVARELGLNPVGIIPVDLFGLPADYDAILPIAEEHGLWVLADAAQSFGAVSRERRVGTLCGVTATSFFPAKPLALGCYGDGGAVLTNDAGLAEVLRSLRVHGQGSHKYENVRIGLTARLDTMQAAVLLQKLEIFEDELRARNGVAAR
jgi:dTDP-4-amino-4,6-dideoxygalactose transaminase